MWGIHAAVSDPPNDVEEMVTGACRTSLAEGFGNVGDWVIIVAGMPFGVSGTTNMLRIAKIE